MLEVSRRNFLKATALSAVCLSGLNASFLEFSQAKQVKYFIKTMAADYGMRVAYEKNKVIFILGFWHQKELNYNFTKKCFAK